MRKTNKERNCEFFLKECLFKLYEQKININLDLNLFSYQNFLVSCRPTWNLSFSQSIWSLNFFSFPMRGLLYSFSKNKKKPHWLLIQGKEVSYSVRDLKAFRLFCMQCVLDDESISNNFIYYVINFIFLRNWVTSEIHMEMIWSPGFQKKSNKNSGGKSFEFCKSSGRNKINFLIISFCDWCLL